MLLRIAVRTSAFLRFKPINSLRTQSKFSNQSQEIMRASKKFSKKNKKGGKNKPQEEMTESEVKKDSGSVYENDERFFINLFVKPNAKNTAVTVKTHLNL